jgi:hypothetical protein
MAGGTEPCSEKQIAHQLWARLHRIFATTFKISYPTAAKHEKIERDQG